jgi:hypothetical protein
MNVLAKAEFISARADMVKICNYLSSERPPNIWKSATGKWFVDQDGFKLEPNKQIDLLVQRISDLHRHRWD